MDNKQWFCGGLVLVACVLVGCEGENAQLAEYAQENARWQAEQSQTLLTAQQNLADGSRGLVNADAASRHELATLQRELREDQSQIARQYEHLTNEHAQWVRNHDRDAGAGATILGCVLLLACLAPLVLGGLALAGRDELTSEEELDATWPKP